MKKIDLLFLVICFCFGVKSSFSQSSIKMDTVFLKGQTRDATSLISINVFDSLNVKTLRGDYRKETGPYLFINNRVIDSVNYIPGSLLYFGDVLIFEKHTEKENYDRKIVSYDLNDKIKKDLMYYTIMDGRDNYLIDKSKTVIYRRTSDNNGIKLYFIDPKDNVETLFADLSKYSQFEYGDYNKGDINFAGIVDVCFFDKKSAFVKLGYNAEASVGYENYMYFFIEEDSIKDITTKVIPLEFSKERNKFLQSKIQFFTSNEQEYFREYFQINNSGMNRILNSKYEPLVELLFIGQYSSYGNQNLLEYPNLINGINMQNGRIVHYFVNSYIDYERRRRDAEVIIPYEFAPRLEIAMYNAYNNKLLSEKDIDGLSKHQLGILRNLLFAKHNYKFNSEFYQAYFNLFAFYNGDDKMKSRTKDINHLLTEADKANITLIRAAEERANGIED